jgi:NDP-4-keto-2,6-dideoxyhexose 3-C-methyltransferase
MRAREQTAGLLKPSVYQEFGARVRQIGAKLQEWLGNERRRGQEVSAYGASTKGNTFLQVFGLDHTTIRSAAERNPEKWGKYTFGTWVPVVSEAEVGAHADNFLVLPWHFMDEIQIREHDFVARDGKLVAPLPSLRMISSTEWSAIA